MIYFGDRIPRYFNLEYTISQYGDRRVSKNLANRNNPGLTSAQERNSAYSGSGGGIGMKTRDSSEQGADMSR